MFVTLKTARSGALRGCIGSLAPRPLACLDEYARKAAFEDARFEPLAARELPGLALSVSLLTGFERAAGWSDWRVGEHGIILDVAHAGVSYRATYLPEVAAEAAWSHEEAVASLLRKAGCPHLPRADWAAIQLTRYVSTKAALTYAEWAAR